MSQLIIKLKEKFQSLFGEQPLIIKSPGRINLIGEHTDYNNGFVLPAAIDKGVYVAIGQRKDDEIHLYSLEFNQEYKTTVSGVAITDMRWPNYILGVVNQLNKVGRKIKGFNLCLVGDLPIGAGLSSSAAVECATLFALNELNYLGLERMQIALMGQKAEHEFAGVKCGIMDQFASVMGRARNAVKLDCRSLEYEYIPFSYDEIEIALFDTQVKHELASSEYNLRRGECEAGVAKIQEKYPEVKSLRDVNINMLDECLEKDSSMYQKCKYVVQEIQRLNDGCADLQQHDLITFGKRMYETHHGLSKLYKVSCPELDYVVEQVEGIAHVYGSRMMGGGFGGCTINLIKKGETASIFDALKEKYYQEFGRELFCYTVKADDGTKVVI